MSCEHSRGPDKLGLYVSLFTNSYDCLQIGAKIKSAVKGALIIQKLIGMEVGGKKYDLIGQTIIIVFSRPESIGANSLGVPVILIT